MSKLTQIEAALKAIDQAGFQRLADTYLRRIGHEHLNPIGVAFGYEKTTTGTPDSLVSRPDGKYEFAEHTTQQDGLARKFDEDLNKCFDEKKTGIPLDRIAEVILCHNGKLSPAEEHALAEKCRAHGVLLTTVGLGFLAHELYEKYPGLARDFLGIEVDTGQILLPEDFVATYSRGSLAPPLDTTFRFRAEEVGRVVSSLEEINVVLVSGRPGVGKSRLALHAMERYCEDHPTVRAFCIFNRGADLFQDLRVHFTEPGNYLILVDDANRLTRFEYALDLLRSTREDRTFKILATVRDYALEPVLEAARQFGAREPIELQGLSEEEIQTLVREEFNIVHPAFLERIASVARGNPRLAMMAASVVQTTGTLASIEDVSDIYDEYFRSIRQDIADIHDSTLLQVAAVVAFFRNVDRSNAEMMGSITDAFDLDPDVFWRAVRRLHDLEVVDLYEDEIVRVSDQVLATYLFYLAIFKEGALDLGVLLSRFFPRFRHRFVDALNPVVDAFDSEVVANSLRPQLKRVRDIFEQRGDRDAVLQLLDTFGILIPVEALITVRDLVSALGPESVPDSSSLSFQASNNSLPTGSPLSILSHFHQGPPDERNIAVNLIVDYLERRPTEAPLVVRMLNEEYGVRYTSYLSGFAAIQETSEILSDRARGGENRLVARLLLAYAQGQLHTRFHRLESKGGSAFAIYDFYVPATDELLNLRRFLWEKIFALFRVSDLQHQVLALLEAYIRSGLDTESRELVSEDAPLVLKFFVSSLDPSSHIHRTLVLHYIEVLERLDISFDPQVPEQFDREDTGFPDVLFVDRLERLQLGWEEYERQRQERLAAYAATLDASGLRELMQDAAEFRPSIREGYREFQFDESVTTILCMVAARLPEDFADELVQHLKSGNALALQPYRLAAALIGVCGPDSAYERLAGGSFPGQYVWLLGYFMALPQEAVTPERLSILYRIYEEAPPGELLSDLSYLTKFVAATPDIFIGIARILVTRAETAPMVGRALASLFRGRQSQFTQALNHYFADDPQLLAQAYFAACRIDVHVDHDGTTFDALLTMYPDFAREWIMWIYERKEWLTPHDDSRNYAVIWRRPDAASVMRVIVNVVQVASADRIVLRPYLLVFFRMVEGTADAAELFAAQDAFLDSLIIEHHHDTEMMELLFSVISEFSDERRRGRLATFLQRNQDFQAFRALSLEPSYGGWSGSAVPWYQARVVFWESLLPLFNTPELLSHRQLVTQKIDELRRTIEHEKKRDFMRD